MGSTKVIDDLVVLGRAAPEPISDGRETVCLGGYSESEGWIRLYPTQRRMTELRRWNVISVPVECDESHDNRIESYKIAGSKDDWDNLHRKVEKVGRLDKPERMELADRLAGDCTHDLNKNRQSLGLVEPREIFDSQLKETDGDSIQHDLFGNPRKGKNDYPFKLYINYRCKDCSQKTRHDQSTIEWGVYQYWNKNDDFEGVIDALNLHDDGTKKYFFVGNLNNQRGAYIIISILRFQKEELLRNGILTEGQSSVDDWM